ncbi:MAG: 2-C-methyl-D-erythritol 4-phosphate cytidylyltransferase [Erysipelothrix sp.]|jgi:2-C-methyl-D-erythritol 4-phosphate cytidylyltransferase|nr:2-C-methyl-D-erythritol 4-phosphate cytidylyltransferase [Erysipelothrix sp.]
MNYSLLLLAAGKNTKMGLGYTKMFYSMDDGETVLHHALQIFLSDQRCKQIVIVTNRTDMPKILLHSDKGKVMIVNGGDRRIDSVYNGLMAIKEDVVLIHDGARPFVKLEAVNRLLGQMDHYKACVLGIQSKDIIKEVYQGFVKETIESNHLMLIQTPQSYKTSFIINCYTRAIMDGIEALDDATIVELTSEEPIKVVDGNHSNYKITTKEDVN